MCLAPQRSVQGDKRLVSCAIPSHGIRGETMTDLIMIFKKLLTQQALFKSPCVVWGEEKWNPFKGFWGLMLFGSIAFNYTSLWLIGHSNVDTSGRSLSPGLCPSGVGERRALPRDVQSLSTALEMKLGFRVRACIFLQLLRVLWTMTEETNHAGNT